MASLKEIVGNKSKDFVGQEANIEEGQLYVFQQNRQALAGVRCTGKSTCQYCWLSPGTGKIQIEIWGAGGSAGRQCCCSNGLPGNPGAYARKTLCVDASTYILACTGLACCENQLCVKACSGATCIIICSPNGLLTSGIGHEREVCLCAEGGWGGLSLCTGSSSPYYCYRCFDSFGTCCLRVANTYLCSVNRINCDCSADIGCGVICNVGGWQDVRRAYGGDFNCNSGDVCDPYGPNWSCLVVGDCGGASCNAANTIAIPPGYGSEHGTAFTFNHQCGGMTHAETGGGQSKIMGLITMLGRHAGFGAPINSYCYSNNRPCACYEQTQCAFFLPPGIPAAGQNVRPDVIDNGYRGGSGGMKIKYLGT